MTLTQAQAQLRPWVQRNFSGRCFPDGGERPPCWPLLGAAKEIGELAQAYRAQEDVELPVAIDHALRLVQHTGQVAHAALKAAQGIRGTFAEHRAACEAAVEQALGAACDAAEDFTPADLRTPPMVVPEAASAEVQDALADTLIYLLDLANSFGINLDVLLAATLAQVTQRDWVADPVGGVG